MKKKIKSTMFPRATDHVSANNALTQITPTNKLKNSIQLSRESLDANGPIGHSLKNHEPILQIRTITPIPQSFTKHHSSLADVYHLPFMDVSSLQGDIKDPHNVFRSFVNHPHLVQRFGHRFWR
ncbi:hypothetical protein CEP52_001866 [Fusarium oligoseptatum]|uniref:Uncharacterized protein n=1 Tax=Fusarium oligoseptatum TaxID=2604345 RepID=A0A428UGC2_9HYPO|nr:hypothetical protein CEP52_001866 [Fusarium oligoseptatum]